MPRLTPLVLILAAVCCCAQVTVTPQGTATTPGVLVPAPPASPPIVYAPLLHLNNGIAEVENTTAQEPAQTTSASSSTLPFNFGVAQFASTSSAGGVGQDIDGKSLAEIAREMHGATTTNARTFTNSDIEALSGHSTTNGNPSSTDRWPANNGVISTEPQPNAIAAPAPQARSPFAPPSNLTSDEAASNGATSPAGVEIAQNTQPPSAQDAVNPPGTYSYPRSSRLPQTGSRLPLLGVLGLFTICVGIFVRYQRARTNER